MKDARIYVEGDFIVVDFRVIEGFTDYHKDVDVVFNEDSDGGTITFKPNPVTLITHQPRIQGAIIDKITVYEPNESERATITATKIRIKRDQNLPTKLKIKKDAT